MRLKRCVIRSYVGLLASIISDIITSEVVEIC